MPLDGGWGRIVTTGLTIMNGLHFQQSYSHMFEISGGRGGGVGGG